MEKHILIVASECDAAVEDDYNAWYNDVHLPMFLGYAGLKKASRYRLTGEAPDCARYLAFYEFETAEALAGFSKSEAYAAAVQDFDEKWKNGGFHGKWAASYQRLASRER
jgi:hypothetical protein